MKKLSEFIKESLSNQVNEKFESDILRSIIDNGENNGWTNSIHLSWDKIKDSDINIIEDPKEIRRMYDSWKKDKLRDVYMFVDKDNVIMYVVDDGAEYTIWSSWNDRRFKSDLEQNIVKVIVIDSKFSSDDLRNQRWLAKRDAVAMMKEWEYIQIQNERLRHLKMIKPTAEFLKKYHYDPIKIADEAYREMKHIIEPIIDKTDSANILNKEAVNKIRKASDVYAKVINAIDCAFNYSPVDRSLEVTKRYGETGKLDLDTIDDFHTNEYAYVAHWIGELQKYVKELESMVK